MVPRVNDYQTEQLEALTLIGRRLQAAETSEIDDLMAMIRPYLDFRRRTTRFLETHFSGICTRNCYRNRLSACCSKDGIITFFGDAVVNFLTAPPEAISEMKRALRNTNDGCKCVYLGEKGCLWRVKPIVCEMFLCDAAQSAVFDPDPELKNVWQGLLEEKQRFTWPDRPILFDRLEAIFIEAGYRSPLMYLHNSPGLLRIKRQSSQQDAHAT